MVKLFLFTILLHGAVGFTVVVLAHHQTDFISIDCGISADADYDDETTGMDYVSDTKYIATGVNKDISPEYNSSNLEQPFWNVRSFPEGTKNCYTLNPIQGKNGKYLVRARFMYGNYDATGDVPEFDLYLGVNKWSSVKLKDASTLVTLEIIQVAPSDYVQVCLVKTGSGTPFISALELRYLSDDNLYATETGSLQLFARLDCGLADGKIVRFPDDTYDRIWSPSNSPNWTVLSSDRLIDALNDQPPQPVMRTAVTLQNGSHSPLLFSWEADSDDDPNTQYYIYMYFAEVQKLDGNQLREFRIYLNGDLWSGQNGPFSPTYLYTNTKQDQAGNKSAGSFNFSLIATANSTLPPLINAYEIYKRKQLLQSPTAQDDSDAMNNIKLSYGLKRNWQGDPCLPQVYLWDGLNCSYDGQNPPRIISLNLSSSTLTGKIANSIASLKMIQILDLSKNSLTGPVPDFLSQLSFLKVLNLEGNKLSGAVPEELIAKSNNGTLTLSLGENPDLCLVGSCKNNNNKFIAPVVGAIGGLFILVLAAIAVFWRFKKKKQGKNEGNVNVESKGKDEIAELKGRQFAYHDVVNITKNFERVIGKGGYGKVYHGYIDDIQVAVKMLSPSSLQGFKQFKAEAKLLMRVHHRNLTTLIGYCDEEPNLGLIYEYMANGNLEEALSDKNPNFLSWDLRLRVAADAAQGLEYLHNGCKPPIIHRDVKSTNILLNENLEAKLSDFGMSRAFQVESGSNLTTGVAGTPGYLDPEYLVSARLNEKSDVYSFGVVLLEIITSRRAFTRNEERSHVIDWVDFALSKGDIKSIVDPRLGGNFDINSVWKAVEVAMACTSSTSTKRPTMAHVVMDLNQCLAMEMARTANESSETDSRDIGMASMIMHTGATPVAR